MNTMKKKCVLNNEDGFVLIIALVILAVLLVLGISATTTSNIENLVTRNVEDYTIALYFAEAAAMQGIQGLDDVVPNPRDSPSPPTWLNPTVDDVTEANILDENYWAGGAPYTPDAGIGGSQLLAGFNGIAGSLDMGKSNVYEYTIYGRGRAPNGGLVIIGVGYRRAF